ncbi:DUF4350 domain-containing protein [Chitinophaga sp. HK235]|uniref:DUF4350 domain-containing protein n=1 Tax=Chitinophaga sp. HK235 TaxID=2952571 RepID=UPI001BA707E2|nr:DUF4350 domain-containing protein [Chitinophaga sp. HK235]
MKKRTTYIIIVVVALLLIMLALFSSTNFVNTEQLSTNMENASFSSKDKKAGGTYVAFKTLPELFAGRPVQVVTKPFATTYDKETELHGSNNAYIIVANELFATERDVESMLYYASLGNFLFISVNRMDPLLAKKLKFTVVDGENFQQKKSNTAQRYKDPSLDLDTAFSYMGMISGSYFSGIDTATTTVFGMNYKSRPNFIGMAYGDGFVYVSLNPYTFSNYFLLHQKNIGAQEIQMSYLPDDATNVYWDDFYSHQYGPQSGDFSEWQVLMRYPAMRWALWLAVLLLLLYVIFEGKRRQRIIPEKPVLANNSLEFVDAVGQLYYQQRNNYNLAHKMIIHLLEYIRSRYYLNTNHLNDQFVEALAKKAAMPEITIRELFSMLHQIQLAGEVSDEQLKDFYQLIQHFYLNTK